MQIMFFVLSLKYFLGSLKEYFDDLMKYFQKSPEMHEEMRNYWIDEDIRYKWDTLQRDFQCCGALNLKTGFQVNCFDQSTNRSD